MPISDCWPELEGSLALLDSPTHKRITSLHELLLPRQAQIQEYASSLHPDHLPCTLITSTYTWGQSFLVYEIVFDPDRDGVARSWVARFGLPPYEGDEFFNTPEQLERKIHNEVAALKVVKDRTTVPVPDIFGFCSRHGVEFQKHFGMPVDEGQHRTHPLGEIFPAFILMSAMRGKTIEDCGFPVHELGGHWENSTSDPAYHTYLESPIFRRYLSSLATIHVQLSQITFPQIGSFTLDEDTGEVRMGPMAEFGLGPFDTAEEYYSVMAEAFKRIAESAVVDEDDEDEEGGNSEVVINIQSSSGELSLPSAEVKALRRMFTASLFPLALAPHLSAENNNGPFPLRHGDLHSENILVDEDTGEIVGVIDWEGAGTVPWEAAGALNWEVQGDLEVESLARPEVHGTFNQHLKEIEYEMKARFDLCTRRPARQLQFEEASKSSKCSSDYVTAASSISPSSSRASLDSSSSESSESSVASAGASELFSDTEGSHSRHPSQSRSNASSRSNLTGITSAPTSPASSLFDIVAPKTANSSLFAQTQAKLMSVFQRTASEPTGPSILDAIPLPSTPTKSTHARSMSLTPEILESIREPLPPSPKKATQVKGSPPAPTEPPEIASLSLSVAALAIAATPIPSRPPSIHTLAAPIPRSASPSGHPPRSSSPSTPLGTPVTSPRRFVHKRKQSSMVLSIPALLTGPPSAMGRLSPGGSPGGWGSGSLTLPPFHAAHGARGRDDHSRPPSPSTSAPSTPLMQPSTPSHIRPGAGHHTRRPSTFYLASTIPASLSRSASGSGSMSGMSSVSSSMSRRSWTTAPSSPVISVRGLSGANRDFPFPSSLSSRSVSGSGSVESSSTGTTIKSAVTPTATKFPAEAQSTSGYVDSPLATTPEIKAQATPILESKSLATPTASSPVCPSTLAPAPIIRKTSSLSMDAQPPVTSPSGMLLSELHASLGSYVAGYLGHWMYVYACEWETVGKALWDVVDARSKELAKNGEAAGAAGGVAGKGESLASAEDEDPAEKAFWAWVKDVWMVEQAAAREEDEA